MRFFLHLFLAFLCLGLPTTAHAGRVEAGTFTAHATNTGNPNPVRINFQNAFDTTPIVVALSDSNGGDAAAIRITNVDTAGFDELIIESDNFDGPHASQTVHYIAVEPGRHILPDGTIIEGGTSSVSAVQHGNGVTGPESWASISFAAAYGMPPAVVAQIQTANSETRNVATQSSRPFITATLDTTTTTGFQVALERSEVSGGPIPSAETIGWIAVEDGSTGSFLDISNNSITWSALNSATNIRGWGNGCFTNGFGQTSATAVVVAKKNSHIGGDGGWLRQCSLSSTTIGLRVDEDTSRDTERNHIAESAAIIAFSQAFHALLEADITVTKSSVSQLDDFGSDFALPNAVIEYLVTVTNAGTSPPDSDSVVVIEELPEEVALAIGDFGGPGSGPIAFSQGSPASGLTCVFSGFASTTDCFDFSTDGINYGYEPVDSGDGTDPNVRFVRAMPSGRLAPDTGSGAPSFELRFNVKIN